MTGIMGSCNLSKELFDPIRKCYVPATGEERVRQWLIHRMLTELGYPQGLLAVEKAIQELPGPYASQAPKRRIDLVCFEKSSLSPLFLIECKDSPCSKEALLQVVGYNHFVRAPFIGVIGRKEDQIQSLIGFWNRDKKQYFFKTGIPSYLQLLDPVFCASFTEQQI